jgi:CRISPR-associated protein Cas5t
VKTGKLGASGNTRPDYQQLLSPVELVIWLDSTEEVCTANRLESRVEIALDPGRRGEIDRFGGLCLGESTHLVDTINRFEPTSERMGRIFLETERGRLTLPVWVDHVGSAGTNYVTGDLEEGLLTPPDTQQMPRILPKETPL